MPSPNEVISQKVASTRTIARSERDPGPLDPVGAQLGEPAADDLLGGLASRGATAPEVRIRATSSAASEEGGGVGERRPAGSRPRPPARHRARRPPAGTGSGPGR